MSGNCIIRVCYIFVIALLLSSKSFAFQGQNNDESDPQVFIDLAMSKQKNDPKSAYKDLKKALYLANQQNNQILVAKATLEQAQTAKYQQDFYLAQRYLKNAETMLPELNNAEISVHIYTSMSSVQRALKNYDESMEYVHKSLAIARESGEPFLIFMSLQMKGTLLKRMKRYDDSLSTFLSAQHYMEHATIDRQERLLRDIANAYSKVNEPESAIRYFKKSIKVLEDNGSEANMANPLIEMSKIQAKVGRFSNAITSAKQSLSISRDHNIEEYTLKSLVTLSILYRKLSSYEQALRHGLEALKIYKSKSDLNGIAAAANSVGLIYIHLNQQDNAKTYFDEVVAIPQENILPKYRAASLRELSKILLANGQAREGLKFANEAFTLYEKVGDRGGVATVKKNMAYIYHEMGNSIEAINAYNSSISFFHAIDDVWNEAETKVLLANVVLETDANKAIGLAKESLDDAVKIGAKSISEQAYSTLILAEEKLGNYKKALNYAKSKDALINEIKADAINKRLAELHIILDVENKEKQLEVLKREKEVISLELDNKETRLSLLEKEKIINELKSQNTFMIVMVAGVGVLVSLFILSKVYSGTHMRVLIGAIIVIGLFVYSFTANSTDIVKTSLPNSSLDVRPKYTLAVLERALEVSSHKYGDYQLEFDKNNFTNYEKIIAMQEGTRLNLTMAMTTPDWEYLAIPIRIPIRRGVGSYRLLAINKSDQDKFKDVSKLIQLKKLIVGVQKGWILTELLDEEGFITVEGATYDSIFHMLNKRRFDYIPRGIHEAFEEISLRQDSLKELMIEPNLAIHLPQPYYMFVSPKYPEIAERIEYGLEKMVKEGLLQQMFDAHYSDFIKKANLANRTIIELENKFLTKQTPLERKELWLNFDLRTEGGSDSKGLAYLFD